MEVIAGEDKIKASMKRALVFFMPGGPTVL